MPESEVLETLKIHLEEEALIQGWAPGYNLRQCQIPEQAAEGGKNYFFVVEGDVIAGTPAGDNNSESKVSSLPKRDVAASP